MGKRREKEDEDFEFKKTKGESKSKSDSKHLKAENTHFSSEVKAPPRTLNAKHEEGLTWIEAAEEAIDELSKDDDRDPRDGWHYKNEILKMIFKIGHISTSGKTPEGTLNRVMRGRTGRAIFVAVAGKPAHYTLRRFIFSGNDDVFAKITDTSKFDFAHPFPLTRKMLQEFQQKVHSLGMTNSLSAHLTKLLQEGIRRCRAREHESIVFLGGMSQGKSFLIDCILRLTTIPRYSKEVLQVPWEERLQHMLGDIAEVFGTKQGDFQSIFDEIMKRRQLAKRKNFADLAVSFEELKKGQKTAREIIENTIKVFPTGRKKELLHEGCFLLESCPKANKSTTPFPIFIRYGWVPAIVIRFFSDVADVPYDDQKFATLEDCLKVHELTLHHVTSQINQKVLYFVGNGLDFDEDRLYIREKLKMISHNTLLEFVTSEVIVYMPTPILQNNAQLVDCPGYLDAKPTRKKHTQRTIESAKIVWFILSKNLEHCETELNMLPRFINKMAEDSVEHGLVLSWMFEKDKQYNKEEFEEGAFELNNQTIKENRAFLDSWLNDLMKKDSHLESTKAMMSFVKKSIQVLPIYPLLFTSMVLNSQKLGFRDKEKNDKILQQTGGYHILGVLFQFFFGKSIRMIEHLDLCTLEPFEQLLSTQPKTYDHEEQVSIDISALQEVFRKLLQSSPSTRSKCETEENTMELLCDVTESVDKLFVVNEKAMEKEEEHFRDIFKKSLVMKLNDLVNLPVEKKSHLHLGVLIKEVAESIKLFSFSADPQSPSPLFRLGNEVAQMREQLREKREIWSRDSVHYKEPNAIGKSLLGTKSLLFLPEDIQRETLLICTESCMFHQEIPDSAVMICCDGCNVWYHMPCVDVKETDAKKDRWFCSRECKEEVEFKPTAVFLGLEDSNIIEIPILISTKME